MLFRSPGGDPAEGLHGDDSPAAEIIGELPHDVGLGETLLDIAVPPGGGGAGMVIRVIGRSLQQVALALTQIRRVLGDRAQIFGGLGGAHFLEELGRGADGTMTGFAFSEVLVAIYRRFVAGDAKQARVIFERYLPLIRYEAQPGIGLSLRKEILRRRGAIRTSVLRPPAQPLDRETLAELDATLAAVDAAGRESPAVMIR